jgi:hypothetical protein
MRMANTKATDGVPRLGWSIDEYCRLIGISRGTLYNRWRDGTGPRFMRIGTRRVISIEAHEEYRRRCEKVADAG